MLDESTENTKINKKELLNENIENYKCKLLSSYWTEINLIGYKIELLEKQKIEHPNELKSKIIDIGNKIRVIIEKKKRDCFNCGAKQIKTWWDKYLKEQYLCHTCGNYNRKYGKHRHKSLFVKTEKITSQNRNCSICDVTHTSRWYCHSKPGHYLCAACYQKQHKIKKSTKNTKADG
uniref:GATA-type domain-containing protein n=1 Tax=Meloidogyne enterolobii TaxID=390850 RepID=A0A6V7YAN9_MELEN|nr:unnamed protein product [Meloidogyne enterolobii]